MISHLYSSFILMQFVVVDEIKKNMKKRMKALSCVVVIRKQIKQTNAFSFESASDEFYFLFIFETQVFKANFLKIKVF